MTHDEGLRRRVIEKAALLEELGARHVAYRDGWIQGCVDALVAVRDRLGDDNDGVKAIAALIDEKEAERDASFAKIAEETAALKSKEP